MPAYDYAAVADIYDDFLVFDADIDFFKEVTSAVDGPVLELMAGTGRVSLPLVREGVRLTCMDYSRSMLAVLDRKLRKAGLSASVVCGDVCSLPLGSVFEMVILPFQGITELVGDTLQRHAFDEAARVLSAGGRFICTSHNPTVRTATIDGEWHEIGRFRNTEEDELVIRLRSEISDRPGVVEGTQSIEIFDREGIRVDLREIHLEFSLTPPGVLFRLAAATGFRLLRVLGDYQGNEFDEATSPTLILELEKA